MTILAALQPDRYDVYGQQIELTAQTPIVSTVHHPFGSPSGPGLFHVKGMQLPAYIQNVAHALLRSGSAKTESRAIEMAVGIVKNWAHGHDGHGHKVSAQVQAAAIKAIAEWNGDKARAHADDHERPPTAGEVAIELLRHVKTPDGARYFHEAIGQPIGKSQTITHLKNEITGKTLSKTESGDTFEQLFSLKFASQLGSRYGSDFKLVTGAGRGTDRTTPLDFTVDHRGGELKTLHAQAKNQKTAIKATELERKNDFIRSHGLQPLLVVQVVDQDKKHVKVYAAPKFGSLRVSKLEQIGEYKYSSKDFKKAYTQAKGGKRPNNMARGGRRSENAVGSVRYQIAADLERHVRTPAGVKFFHEPIGSPIVSHPHLHAIRKAPSQSAAVERSSGTRWFKTGKDTWRNGNGATASDREIAKKDVTLAEPVSKVGTGQAKVPDKVAPKVPNSDREAKIAALQKSYPGIDRSFAEKMHDRAEREQTKAKAPSAAPAKKAVKKAVPTAKPRKRRTPAGFPSRPSSRSHLVPARNAADVEAHAKFVQTHHQQDIANLAARLERLEQGGLLGKTMDDLVKQVEHSHHLNRVDKDLLEERMAQLREEAKKESHTVAKRKAFVALAALVAGLFLSVILPGIGAAIPAGLLILTDRIPEIGKIVGDYRAEHPGESFIKSLHGPKTPDLVKKG